MEEEDDDDTAAGCGLHLIYQYFHVKADWQRRMSPKDAAIRQEEYKQCLLLNLSHPQVEMVHLLFETQEELEATRQMVIDYSASSAELTKTTTKATTKVTNKANESISKSTESPNDKSASDRCGKGSMSAKLSPEQNHSTFPPLPSSMQKKIVDVKKLNGVLLGRRMRYSDAFEFANKLHEQQNRRRRKYGKNKLSDSQGMVVVVMNADMAFHGRRQRAIDYILQQVQRDGRDSIFCDTVFSLTRHEISMCTSLHQSIPCGEGESGRGSSPESVWPERQQCPKEKRQQLHKALPTSTTKPTSPTTPPTTSNIVANHPYENVCGCPFFKRHKVSGRCAYFGSHDSFWFVPPIPAEVILGCCHIQNRWGSEHVVINELLKHGYEVRNPSLSIFTYHNHSSDLRPWKYVKPSDDKTTLILADPRDHKPLPPTRL